MGGFNVLSDLKVEMGKKNLLGNNFSRFGKPLKSNIKQNLVKKPLLVKTECYL